MKSSYLIQILAGISIALCGERETHWSQNRALGAAKQNMYRFSFPSPCRRGVEGELLYSFITDPSVSGRTRSFRDYLCKTPQEDGVKKIKPW